MHKKALKEMKVSFIKLSEKSLKHYITRRSESYTTLCSTKHCAEH